MVAVRIYVEGGGDQKNLKAKWFPNVFEKILPKGMMPRIIACGSRKDAYDCFCNGLKQRKKTFC